MFLADLYEKNELKNGDIVIDTRTNEKVIISDIEKIEDYGIIYKIGNIKYGSENENPYREPERFIGTKKMSKGGAKKSKKQRNSKRRRTHRLNRRK